jgi:deoxyribose-phosphate aldolase
MTENKKVTIAIGADHGGFPLKESLKEYLTDSSYPVIDCGTTSPDKVDYPRFAYAVARAVADKKATYGIMVDGAGIGSSIVANKVPGIRAALCYDVSSAVNAREHNNANMLTLGGSLIGQSLARQIVEAFLNHTCTEERHLKRVRMIDELDKQIEPQIPETKSPENDKMTVLSGEDIQRIAERVGVLMQHTNKNDTEHCETDMICVCGVCREKKPETLRSFLDFGVDRFGYHDATGCECVPEDIARCIDHTILKPDATEDDIKKICAEAREAKFAAVCVSPSYVILAAKELAGSNVKVCTVVGFPSGAHIPEIKALEARRAIRDGAEEIDMVINVGALKSGQDNLVYRDIRLVCEACEDGGALSKVIIEAALLTDDEKVRACELAKRARAHYVKTSTGFGPGGATAEDVALMSRIVGEYGIRVKAAGGIRSYGDAQKMIAAGATRIGASASIKILQEAKETTVTA